jgi:trehalose 6-phosphate phosphatase
MEYFFDRCSVDLSKRRLFLFLDYDGTMTPIVDQPEKAFLSLDNKRILRELAEYPLWNVAIVTGRALSDIRRLIELEDICYVGNHGFEIEAPGIHFKKFDFSPTKEIFDYLKWQINKELAFFKGAFIEDKEINLCIHYRQLNENKIDLLKTVLNNITVPFFLKDQIRIDIDRKTFEIKPPIDWDKGKAVLWLLNQKRYEGFFPLYIGDSMTDEDAFRVLQNKGITIRVGKSSRSCASYYVNDYKEVTVLLKGLLERISNEQTSQWQ